MRTRDRLTTALSALLLAAALPAPLLGLDREPPPIGPGEVGVEERLGAQVPRELLLVDEDGARVAIGAIVDTPTILTLNYFRCAGICTPLLGGVVEMLDHLPLEPGRDFRVVTVSFDERDTPDIARRKRQNYLGELGRPFPPSAWRFLTGDAASTRALCDAVGFKFKRQGDDFIHVGVIVVLTADGRVSRYIYGTSFLPADVQAAVAEAARGESSPTVSKFLEICYGYDPATRRYGLRLTRVVGLLTLLVAGTFVVAVAVRKARRRAPDPEGESR